MRWKSLAWILLIIACLLLANSVLAMSSSNYVIDWMVPLSGGGGRASSTSFTVHLTIRQTAIGASHSASYQAGWGFWHGVQGALWKLFLPLVER